MKRKIISVLLIASMLMLPVGCSNDSSSSSSSSEAQVTTAAADDEEDIDVDDLLEEAGEEETEEETESSSSTGYPYDWNMGTAKELDGNIAVVSVFVSTSEYPWDTANLENDQN